jgi:hypothetical protein
MKALQNLIQDENRWFAITNYPSIGFPLSQSEVDSLARTIDSKLSPENLSEDGEISNAEADRKGEFLNRALDQLEYYAACNNLTVPTVWERW